MLTWNETTKRLDEIEQQLDDIIMNNEPLRDKKGKIVSIHWDCQFISNNSELQQHRRALRRECHQLGQWRFDLAKWSKKASKR